MNTAELQEKVFGINGIRLLILSYYLDKKVIVKKKCLIGNCMQCRLQRNIFFCIYKCLLSP